MRLIVVGGGIAGAACAYAASTLGADVTLVDAGHTGRATAAGAGIISPWWSRGDDDDRYALSCAAAAAYPKLINALAAEGEASVGYAQPGTLIVSEHQDRAAVIRDELVARQVRWPEMGEVEAVGPADARALFPPLAPDMAAVHVSGGARVDGRLMAAALTRAALRRGGTVTTGLARLVWAGGRAKGVQTADGLIEGDAIVAATGAWTDEFLAPAGVRFGVTPQRGQIVHLGLPGTDTSRWPVVLPEGSSHYLLTFDDSRVVVGATRETGAAFDYRVTAGGLAEVLARALTVAPGLAAGTHLETRIGFRPMGPDARPLVGPVPGVAGLIVLTGLGASGLTMGPFAGELAARAALGVAVPVDLGPFDPARAAR